MHGMKKKNVSVPTAFEPLFPEILVWSCAQPLERTVESYVYLLGSYLRREEITLERGAGVGGGNKSQVPGHTITT